MHTVKYLRSLALVTALVLFAFQFIPASASTPPAVLPSGRLIVSAENGGTWNIFAADPANGTWQKIQFNALPARDPAISPDGKSIVFRSKRDGVWEIYVMAATGGTATRLTRGMIFSGAPAWSPDNQKIAFESYARGDLDIWLMNADGTQLVNLTDNEKTHDYAPAWSPDGKWIAFTSWRTGTRQIFVVAADCVKACQPINLSRSAFDDSEPVWSPDGKQLAFVSNRDGQRAIYLADFSTTGLRNTKRITFSGWDDHPAWSPDGRWLAFVSARPNRQSIYIVSADGGIPRIVENAPTLTASVAWTNGTLPNLDETSNSPRALFQEQPDLAPANSGHPYEFRRPRASRLESGASRLSSRVVDSYNALQERVRQEVGYDFLAIVSDMFRAVDVRCDVTCDTLSWHKAGRAVDTRLDYSDARIGNALEIVREDQLGGTYFRVYLKASAQDGTLGEPLKDAPWDLSYRARWVIGRGEGGTTKPVPYGFWVDFTELARQYGWERISAHDSDEFDWKTNKIGAEYWHYQQQHGLNWYQAMREVYSEAELKSLVEFDTLVRTGYNPYVIYLKGIPLPAKAWQWNVLAP